MAKSCDEIFNDIQTLNEQKRKVDEAREVVFSPNIPDNGIDNWMNDAEMRRQASERMIGKKAVPVGADGQPTNFKQLVDMLGEEEGELRGADLIGLNRSWQMYDRTSYDRYLAVEGTQKVADDMAAVFAEAGVDISRNELMNQIQRNVQPFVNILLNAKRLQAYADITRASFSQEIARLSESMAASGGMPSKQELRVALKKYQMATYAFASRSLASRRSGQLLRNWKVMGVSDGDALAGMITEQLEILKKEQAAVAEELTTKPDPTTGEPVTAKAEQMINESDITGRIIEAAIEGGEKGSKAMKEIQKTLDLQGLDPEVGPGTKGWERVWTAAASAGYKDSILFNSRTQGRSNYLSQKLIFLAEGYRNANMNPYRLRAGDRLSLEQQTDLFDPTAEPFLRNRLKAQIDGYRIAAASAQLAESVITSEWSHLRGLDKYKESWGRALGDAFFDNKAPFAGNADNFRNKGTMSIEAQYLAASEILGAKFEGGPLNRSFQLADKLHWGLKVLANKTVVNPLLNKAGFPNAPVLSSLQLMTAVDQRQGMRVYLTTRANDLLIEEAVANPRGTLKDWREAVGKKLQDELYQLNPSKEQINAYREQFSVGSEITDEMISEHIAYEKVGAPVLNTPERVNALQASVEQRMQGKMRPGSRAAKVDQAIQTLRQDRLGDAVISFWRSPFNQNVWDWVLGAEPITGVIRMAGVAKAGKQATPEMKAKAQASMVVGLTMLGLFAGLKASDNIIGGGPLNPKDRQQWELALEAQGKKRNSILGIPVELGGVPILNTLFLYSDAYDMVAANKDAIARGDLGRLGMGIVQIVAAQIMRTPGFRQFEILIDSFTSGNPKDLLSTISFLANGLYNPASGVIRDLEGAAGVGRRDLYPPNNRIFTQEGSRLMRELGDDHPINAEWQWLRSYVYQSTPGLAHWLGGVPTKDYTYLGDPLRLMPQMLGGEWPIGWPSLDDSLVTNQLKSMNLLQPPSEITQGIYRNVPLELDGVKEFNQLVGSVRSERGFGRDRFSSTGGRFSFNPTEGKGYTADYTKLLSDVTKGKTLREALNALFRHEKFQAIEADPEFSQDPSVVNLTRGERLNRPASQMVKKLHDYYAEMAGAKFEASGSPASNAWAVDYGILTVTPREAAGKARDLQNHLR